MKLRRAALAGGRTAGFTLVELMISAAVVGGLFYAIALTSTSASKAYEASMERSRLVSKAHEVLDRITDEFVEAELGTMTPAAPGVGASTITYRVPESFAGNVITWSADRTIAFQMDAGEFDDGADNDGDGLVDEGVVVLMLDVGLGSQRQVTLCHDVRSLLAGELGNLGDDNGNVMVDERGLVFELNGNVLTVQLTLETLDESGRLISKTVRTSVRVRN